MPNHWPVGLNSPSVSCERVGDQRVKLPNRTNRLQILKFVRVDQQNPVIQLRADLSEHLDFADHLTRIQDHLLRTQIADAEPINEDDSRG